MNMATAARNKALAYKETTKAELINESMVSLSIEIDSSSSAGKWRLRTSVPRNIAKEIKEWLKNEGFDVMAFKDTYTISGQKELNGTLEISWEPK